VESYLTGWNPIYLSQTDNAEQGDTIWREMSIGIAGALIILFFVFATLPAVLLPLLTAMASIMTTFLAVWGLTYATDVSIIVSFLIGLVGLGIAIDYSLLMIFRFREELAHGKNIDDALVETSTHAGRAVIVSGSTVAIGLLSMIVMPIPFIRAMGLGGMLIPLVSVLATLTLQVAILSLLGHRINRFRIPLISRMTDVEHDRESRFWTGWAHMVTRRPLPIFVIGAVLLGLLAYPALDMNPRNPTLKSQPATGDAAEGREIMLDKLTGDGALNSITVFVEGDATPAQIATVVNRMQEQDHVLGASAPADGWSKDGSQLIEVVQDADSNDPVTEELMSELHEDVLPALEEEIGGDVQLTLAGAPREDYEFTRTVYDNFPYVLLFVVLLTYVLLARALRSLLLPLKAVILNLLSLMASFGVIVFIFQQGHMADAIWGYDATESIVPWIPLMIFAFLYGISMDYEVFILSRMREAYDEFGDTNKAVVEGLSRTGKLVTSAALILMFTFLVMSMQPGADFKQFAIGLAAGIIIDATLVRLLLVPSIVTLMGRWNWWMPKWAATILFVREPIQTEPEPKGPPTPPEPRVPAGMSS
jgi:RND superfamily putative drug exporter